MTNFRFESPHYPPCINFRSQFFSVELQRPGHCAPENMLSPNFFGPKMDRFVTRDSKSIKSGSNINAQSAKWKPFDNKKYDSSKRKRPFQTSWLEEFPWLVLDSERGVMKCTTCSKWPNTCDRQSPLVLGSDRLFFIYFICSPI